MSIKIVVDSSANIESMKQVDFASVPLKIIAGEKEYTDDANLDVQEMLKEMADYKGPSSTACPGIGDWLNAFADADIVFGAAVTSKLSGSYNAAKAAADAYMEENSGKKVFIFDSLSAGPELVLLVEKYMELIEKNGTFEEICSQIEEYAKRTHLGFSLESLDNFVKNGRVNPTVAKLAGMLNIRIVGKASAVGDLEPLNKCRGEERAVKQVYKNMLKEGYQGGKARIHHTNSKTAAEQLCAFIKADYSEADVKIADNRGLCSYYVENGGLLVGFES